MFMRRSGTRCLGLAFSAFALACAAGCGRGTYPVEGKVVLRGENGPAVKLVGYLVMLQAVDKPLGADGHVQADGTFRVGTHQPGDGAPPGMYKVVIVPPIGDSGDSPRPVSILDPKYENFETSGLEVEVKPQRNNVTLTVERRNP
jgi:hypothetical protein